MLRQAVAIHCGTYACILYCESKAKQCLVWIGIAFFMHVSSIILLSIYLYPFVKKLNNKWLEIILIISFIGSFFLNLKTFSFLTDYLPPAYAAHLEKEEMSSSIITSLTKYIFIPFFYWGLKLLENNSLNDFEKITDAKDEYDQFNKPCVSMSMNTDGARRWAVLTKNNVGILLLDFVT